LKNRKEKVNNAWGGEEEFELSSGKRIIDPSQRYGL